MIFNPFRRRLPDPPRNVRITHPDGTTEPLEFVYEYTDRDGQHHWIATRPTTYNPWHGDHITVDYLPGHTVLAFDGHTERID